MDSRDLLEERVSTRGSAASPTGAHVADIYLANLNKYVTYTHKQADECGFETYTSVFIIWRESHGKHNKIKQNPRRVKRISAQLMLCI